MGDNKFSPPDLSRPPSHIAAALSNNPMQNDQGNFQSPNQQMTHGGPMRVQQMPIRTMPYTTQPGRIGSPQVFSQAPIQPTLQSQYCITPNNRHVPMQPAQPPMQMNVQQIPSSSGMQQMTLGQAIQMGQQPQFIQQQQQQQQQQPQPQMMAFNSNGSVLEKKTLDQLTMQINQNSILEDNVKESIIEFCDEFVDSIVDKACRLIKARGSKKIEARDIEFILENVYNIPAVPRAAVHLFGAPGAVDIAREKFASSEAHKQRVAMLKKQIKKI